MGHEFRDVFDWGFIASFTVASTAVLAVANTLRLWWKLEPRWSALAAAEVLAFYAATAAQSSYTIGRFFIVLAYGVLLCCYAVGMQASIVGLKQRFSPAARAGAPAGWWDAWF